MAVRCRALDIAGDFVAQKGVLAALFWPEHLLDRVIERRQARLDAWLSIESPDGVVQQERRRRPQADQRRGSGITAAVARHIVLPGLARFRIVDRKLADRRQFL